jgi:hypothetical protein
MPIKVTFLYFDTWLHELTALEADIPLILTHTHTHTACVKNEDSLLIYKRMNLGEQHKLWSFSLSIALMMEAARTSETLVNIYQITRCYNPEDSNLHTHRCENLKSYFSLCNFLYSNFISPSPNTLCTLFPNTLLLPTYNELEIVHKEYLW